MQNHLGKQMSEEHAQEDTRSYIYLCSYIIHLYSYVVVTNNGGWFVTANEGYWRQFVPNGACEHASKTPCSYPGVLSATLPLGLVRLSFLHSITACHILCQCTPSQPTRKSMLFEQYFWNTHIRSHACLRNPHSPICKHTLYALR